MPENLTKILRNLNAQYIVSRYPDAANGVPADMYDEAISGIHIKETKVLIKWIRSKLNLK